MFIVETSLWGPAGQTLATWLLAITTDFAPLALAKGANEAYVSAISAEEGPSGQTYAHACGVVIRLVPEFPLDFPPSEDSVVCFRGVTPWTDRTICVNACWSGVAMLQVAYRYETCLLAWTQELKAPLMVGNDD